MKNETGRATKRGNRKNNRRHSMPQIIGKIEETDEPKRTTKGSFKLGVKIAGEWYSTFGTEEEIQALAKWAVSGTTVTVEYETAGKYRNIKKILPPQQPTQKPPTEKPKAPSQPISMPTISPSMLRVTLGRTIKLKEYENLRIEFSMEFDNDALSMADTTSLKNRALETMRLWIAEEEAQHR